MKNKNKKSYFLFSLLLLAGVFGCGKNASSFESTLVISEVSIGIESANNEFVEIYNYGNEDIDIQELGLKLKIINSSGVITSKTLSWVNKTIPGKGFFLFGAGEVGVEFDATYGGSLLSGTGGVIIADKNNIIIDRLTWNTLKTGQSLKRIEGNFNANNTSSFVLQENPDPQNSAFIEEEPDEIICLTNSPDIRLNEIFPYPESGDEFVELINNGADCVDISNWKIMDGVGHKIDFPENSVLFPGEYFKLERNLYLNNDSDTVYLLGSDGTKKEDAVDSVFYEEAKKNYSWSFDGEIWLWTSVLTAGKDNEFDETNDDEINQEDASTYNVRLNEILSNPKGDEKINEYIEIYNEEAFEINLENWILRDSSKAKFIFPKEYRIESGDYLSIYRDVFKFALNNGEETVSLSDPAGNTISSVSLEGSKENVSYNFDGAAWKWSKFLTPGKENKFNSPPEIKLKKISEGYVGMPVNFEVETKKKTGDKLKFSWNFGDKKKSYTQNPSHIYQKKGSYDVVLSIDDGVEETLKSFTIKIKSYPKLNLEITRLLPNPRGKDAGLEWIEIKNNSKKKVDLKGWRLATGSEKLVNHIINSDFVIKANETKRLTREIAPFYLNNTGMALELRYPDGKTADKVSYKKAAIADDEIYEKTQLGWVWKSLQSKILPANKTILTKAEPIPTNPERPSQDIEVQNNLGKFSESEDWTKKQENKIILLSYHSQIKTPPALLEPHGRVLGAFTENIPAKKHWTLILLENMSTKINFWLNKFILAI